MVQPSIPSVIGLNPLVQQYPLGLRVHSGRCFQNLIVGDNSEAIAMTKAMVMVAKSRPAPVWIYGRFGCGKSHLLEALCVEAEAHGQRVAYIGFGGMTGIVPARLDGYTDFNLVCLDDVDAVIANAVWAKILFNLYNELESAGRKLVMSAEAPVTGLRCALSDLRSRLSASVQFRLQPLDQIGLGLLLQQRARLLGLEVSPGVEQWLLRRIQRDAPTLLDILDRLDRASLAAQRRLTIPFVRDVLKPDRG